MKKEIQRACQRAFKGYDDTIYWDYQDYFNKIIEKTFENFYKQKLESWNAVKDNWEDEIPDWAEKLLTAGKLFQEMKKQKSKNYILSKRAGERFFDYFYKNINYWWD